MPELLEAVSVAVTSDTHDEDCYFCNSKKEPTPEENTFDDSPEDDDDLDGGYNPKGQKFKNDSSALGKALGAPKSPGAKVIKMGAKNCASICAAHHLIPGKAALKKSTLFKAKEYLWTNGKVEGNIGYNVNSSPNGEWLPGNYGVRPWSSKSDDFKKTFAFDAIEKWQKQFHDAHEVYSDWLTGKLNEIQQKLKKGQSIWCPEAEPPDNDPKKRPPLYVLVNRLHTVSAVMRRMLVFPTSNWRSNIWTSAYSQKYMLERVKKK